MTDETKKTEGQTVAPTTPAPFGGGPRGRGGARGPGMSRPGGRDGKPAGGRRGQWGRRDGGRAPRVKPEFEQKIVQIRRVTRVIAGGKRFNFSVAMVIGNRNGSVGVGIGKGADTALAIEKAFRHAKKNMQKLRLTDTKSIPHEVAAKYSSARLSLKPSPGRGLVAGSAVRDGLALAGITDVNAKVVSKSKNKLNIARGTMMALGRLSTLTERGARIKKTVTVTPA